MAEQHTYCVLGEDPSGYLFVCLYFRGGKKQKNWEKGKRGVEESDEGEGGNR